MFFVEGGFFFWGGTLGSFGGGLIFVGFLGELLGVSFFFWGGGGVLGGWGVRTGNVFFLKKKSFCGGFFGGWFFGFWGEGLSFPLVFERLFVLGVFLGGWFFGSGGEGIISRFVSGGGFLFSLFEKGLGVAGVSLFWYSWGCSRGVFFGGVLGGFGGGFIFGVFFLVAQVGVGLFSLGGFREGSGGLCSLFVWVGVFFFGGFSFFGGELGAGFFCILLFVGSFFLGFFLGGVLKGTIWVILAQGFLGVFLILCFFPRVWGGGFEMALFTLKIEF